MSFVRPIRTAGGALGDYQKLDLGTNTYPLNAAVVNGQEFNEYADNWVNKHTIRHANGAWSRFGDVQQAVAPGILGVVGRIGAGAVNGELFLLCGQQNGMGLTGVGLVVRHGDGTWSGPDDVNTPSINPRGDAGFSAMSVSAL